MFDLDGTLVDSRPGIEWAAERAFEKELPGEAPVSLGPFIGPPIPEMLRKAMPGASGEVLRRLEREFVSAYDSEGWRRASLYDGVDELITALRETGRRLFVVTNKRATPTRLILAGTGLAVSVDAAYCVDSAAETRTKTESLQALLAEQRVEPGLSSMVGDDLGDEDAARACGIRFIGAGWGYGRLRGGSRVAGDLADLAAMLGLPTNER